MAPPAVDARYLLFSRFPNVYKAFLYTLSFSNFRESIEQTLIDFRRHPKDKNEMQTHAAQQVFDYFNLSYARECSFAQWRYSNQWSNREVLLLLVENYTQYPAQ